MARRVPILRQHDIGETFGQAIDERNDLLALGDRQAAAGQKAILHIDHDQDAALVDLDLGLAERAAGVSQSAAGRRRRKKLPPLHDGHRSASADQG